MYRRLFVLSVALFAADAASAQGFRPGPGLGTGINGGGPGTPAVSPYLNIQRRGSSAAVNYYALVKPALDTQNALKTLQQDVDAQTTATGGLGGDANALITGSRPRFLNTGGYFQTVGGGAPGRPGGGGGGGQVIVVNTNQGNNGGQVGSFGGGQQGQNFRGGVGASPSGGRR